MAKPYPDCATCGNPLQLLDPSRPSAGIACVSWIDDDTCPRFGKVVEVHDAAKVAARAKLAEESREIAAAAAAMTLDDVPWIERLAADRQDEVRASVLESYQRLTAHMAARETTRWAESERAWADILGLSRSAAVRRLARFDTWRWARVDKRPILVTTRDGRTVHAKPQVRRTGYGFATITGGQLRVKIARDWGPSLGSAS